MQSLNDLPASVRTVDDVDGTRQIMGAGIKRAAGGRLKDFAGRGARLGRDLPVLLLVGVVSSAFVDPSHPVVAMLFGWTSACGALRQMIAHRAGGTVTSAGDSIKYRGVFVAVAWWCAGMFATAHRVGPWPVPPMPFALQSVGVACLLFAMATPFLRLPQIARGAFDVYPHAVGSVLLTGSPAIAIVIGAWMLVSARTLSNPWSVGLGLELQHVPARG